MFLNFKLVSFIAIFLLSSAAFAGPVWEGEVDKWELNRDKQSFCYLDTDGIVKGTNVDIPVRIASVSKIYTSYYAISKLGADKTFETRAFIKGNQLHISGSFDPLFGYRKLFYLLDQLQLQGYSEFKTVTFDSKLIVVPSLLNYNELTDYPTSREISKHLTEFFNTKKWSKRTTLMFNKIKRYNLYPGMETKLSQKIKMKVGSVSFSKNSPFPLESSDEELSITSAPLTTYLKFLNVTSNNGLAEFVFRAAGDINDFKLFTEDEFGFDSNKIVFHTGSGMPRYINKKRKDNVSTCAYTVQVLSKLDDLIEDSGIELQDIMAVAGVDAGTFTSRFNSSKYRRFMIAKTGTVRGASALAGYISTDDYKLPFGLFESSIHTWKGKALENTMISALINSFGELDQVDYLKRSEFFSMSKAAEWK